MIGIDDLFTIRIFTAIQVSAQLLCPACDDVVNGPTMTGQHAICEAVYVFRCVTAEYIRHFDHGASQLCHQLIDGFDAHGFGLFSQMRVDAGGVRAAVAQPGLNQTQIDAGLQKMRGPGMA